MDADVVLQLNDLLRVRLPTSSPSDRPLQRAAKEPRFRGPSPAIVYEDEHLLVLDKPAGVAVQPGTGHVDDSICDWLAVRHAPATAGSFVPVPVHRLDRWASGVLLIAKTRRDARELSAALREGALAKSYLVLATGVVTEAEGCIELPLSGKDAAPGHAADPALTRYRVLGRHPAATLLECRIEHGRNHQIRRHLAAIGHPVAGDRRHGDVEANAELQRRFGLRRLFLHAVELTLPGGGDARSVSAPLPAELERVLAALRLRR